MEFIIIIILLLILYFIIQIIYKKKLISNYLTKISNLLVEKHNNVKIKSLENFKNVFEVNLTDSKLYLNVVIVPVNSRIQINNQTTWELKTGSQSSLGDAPKKSVRLNEIEKFMGSSFNGKKIVVLLPKVSKIVKYINECEIILVDENTNVFGASVISGDNFNLFKLFAIPTILFIIS